jgi:hypothetical protein
MTNEERTIADLVLIVNEYITLRYKIAHGCYHNAIFIREYLYKNFNIHVDIVVGWASSTEIGHLLSHAWIEYNGKKTDPILWGACGAIGDFSGNFLIHDLIYQRGAFDFVYQKTLTEKQLNEINKLMHENAEFRESIKSEFELNQFFNNVVVDHNEMTKYDSALDSFLNYESMARMVKNYLYI